MRGAPPGHFRVVRINDNSVSWDRANISWTFDSASIVGKPRDNFVRLTNPRILTNAPCRSRHAISRERIDITRPLQRFVVSSTWDISVFRLSFPFYIRFKADFSMAIPRN
jgi:hypothetical protein